MDSEAILSMMKNRYLRKVVDFPEYILGSSTCFLSISINLSLPFY